MKQFDIHPNSSFNIKYCEIASRLKAAGFSLDDIGYALGFSKSTISSWAKKHPLFKKALEDGKAVAKSHVVAKAFMAACGYDYDESNDKLDAEGNVVGRSIFHKHAQPNPKLIMWLLCNLSPDEWKSEHKILVEKDDTVHVKLDGKVASKQITDLAGRLFNEPKKKKVILEAVADSTVDKQEK